MSSGNEKLHAAHEAKTAASDGLFFVGVSSTGIYCRPVCKAKQPKRENCTFFRSAAEAEKAGYRPCLLCRPELAPGKRPEGPFRPAFYRAARFLEEESDETADVQDLALRFDCSPQALEKDFIENYGVTLDEYRLTSRTLLAKSLLTDTDLSLSQVAQTCGFADQAVLEDTFRKRYRLDPLSLRRKRRANAPGEGMIRLFLGFRPPYQWSHMLRFLAGRTILGVEAVRDGAYYRTVRLPGPDGRPSIGWIRVSRHPGKDLLVVAATASLAPVLRQVLGRVRRQFDLDCSPAVVHQSLSSMQKIYEHLPIPGLRVPGAFDPYELVVRAVLGQQITVKAASTLGGRFAELLGVPIATDTEDLKFAFPSPNEILALPGAIENRLGPIGITGARARTILALAQGLASRDLDLSSCGQPEEQIQKLLGIRGIGPWTAGYIAMRGLGWSDAFLSTDYGVKKALAPRNEREIVALSDSWRPWRAYAAMNLWMAH